MAAPVNTVAPAITGSVLVGQALAVDNGTWTGSPTAYAYAWLRNNVAITGATAASYTIVRADIGLPLEARVTATNIDGSTPIEVLAGTVPGTLIAENGTIVAGAESFTTIAYANTYHEKRGNTAWAALTDDAKESDLRKSTDYMMQAYTRRWAGVRMSALQTLDWPRAYVYTEPVLHGAVGEYPFLVANNIVPVEVQNACAELALRAETEELFPDLERGVLREQIGPISVTYDQQSSEHKRYSSIDAMLSRYFRQASSVMTPLVRT